MSTKNIQIPEQLFRTASVAFAKREGAAEGDAQELTMSISSDEPYKRYDWMNDEDYYEVLDHAPGAVDDSRLKGGLPILFNHDRDQHLARAMSFTNDGKKITVGNLKWSAGDFAQTKKKDAESGALPDTSVGYRITDDGTCIGAKDGIPIYKFKWAIHEGSLVTIPADPSVGVGRGAKPDGLITRSISLTNESVDNTPPTHQKHTTQSKSMSEPTAPVVEQKPVVNVAEERQRAVSTERERVKKINDFVGALKKPEWKTAAAQAAIKSIEAGDDFDTFRMNALNSFEGVSQAVQTSEIGMSAKELKRYSLCSAILGRALNGSIGGFEKECSDAQAKLLGKDPNGFFIPEDWSGRSLQEINGLNQRQVSDLMRTLTTGSFASSGALISTDLLAGSLIELLRNKTVMLSSGVTMLNGLVGNVAVPRQSGGATAYWLAEGGTVTASDQTFQQLGLTPHRLAAQTAYDKQLLAQASISVEAMVRNDIALVMAIKKDLAIINGSGASGEPLGILNTTGVGTVTFSAAATWAKLVSFETALAVANADQTGTPIWVTTPAVRGALKVATKIAASQYSSFLWDSDNTVNGYAAKVTNQVPSDKVLFFVPSEIIDATWAGIDVVVNPYSLDSTGQIRTTVQMFTDIALRHAGAFQVSTDSGAQ